ncbi:hypothetical protein ACGFT2_23975 [Streptomyces sp. NPDC048514]|uniref:hypothetical protein n=1 Tax=Streptomyces sp. NPDC048514 TaxID=3365564 RepID=UPI0037131858
MAPRQKWDYLPPAAHYDRVPEDIVAAARKTIAAAARDAPDCERLLSMLGLMPSPPADEPARRAVGGEPARGTAEEPRRGTSREQAAAPAHRPGGADPGEGLRTARGDTDPRAHG